MKEKNITERKKKTTTDSSVENKMTFQELLKEKEQLNDEKKVSQRSVSSSIKEKKVADDKRKVIQESSKVVTKRRSDKYKIEDKDLEIEREIKIPRQKVDEKSSRNSLALESKNVSRANSKRVENSDKSGKTKSDRNSKEKGEVIKKKTKTNSLVENKMTFQELIKEKEQFSDKKKVGQKDASSSSKEKKVGNSKKDQNSGGSVKSKSSQSSIEELKVVKEKTKTSSSRRRRKKRKKDLYKMTILFIVLDLMAFVCFFLAYGPYGYFRNLLVATAMKTMDHQYLAYVLYSEEMVQKVLNSNYFVAIDEDANTEKIVIDTDEKATYKDKYEEELLTRDKGNDLYKVIDVEVGSAKGYLVAIYDPTKVELIHTKQFNVGTYGERVTTMCDRYGDVVCINGGGFVDEGYGSDIPLGYVIKDNEIIWTPTNEDPNTYRDNIIGITNDGKLKLMSNATGTEALEAGVKDGMVFGPFLIVNGKELEIVGDPWGKSPRVAIAQRKDGVMMFLVVDGKNYIDGASLNDMITILKRYGAYNAANLDGGQSSSLVIDGVLENNPPAEAKRTNGRYVVTGWGLKK